MAGSQGWVPILGPKVGSQARSLGWVSRLGSQGLLSKSGSKVWSHCGYGSKAGSYGCAQWFGPMEFRKSTWSLPFEWIVKYIKIGHKRNIIIKIKKL